MFCPLCQSEFREGFVESSDCHVALVGTLAEASSGSVRLWKGNRQKELDRILSAPDGEQIHSHFREIVNYNWRIEIFGIPIGARRSTFECEVWVFRRDFERARLAARFA
jgi:hypothetical protein